MLARLSQPCARRRTDLATPMDMSNTRGLDVACFDALVDTARYAVRLRLQALAPARGRSTAADEHEWNLTMADAGLMAPAIAGLIHGAPTGRGTA